MSNVRDFGAVGDGKADDGEAILHAIERGDGVVEFPPGDFLITRTLRVELAKIGRLAIRGSGGVAKITMAGPGPAFHILGTHTGTAAPESYRPEVWLNERMPTVADIEVQGRHPGADGFLLEGTVLATFTGVLLRDLNDAIRLHRRARNLLVSHCHIYHNRGVGIFLDRLNLHQAIITGSHISYCKRGGIKIVASEIRNLQITGNDIEYNYDLEAAESADVWIDSSADGSSVREGTIVSNTIQAKYSPGGANVRMVGRNPKENHKAGMFTISNNLIGSQEINVHLVACRGVVVNGNVVYSGHRNNLQLDGARNVVIGPNSFDHNPDYHERELCTGVRIADSHDVALNGVILDDCQAGQHTAAGAKPVEREGLLEIVRSQRVTLSGCQILDGTAAGLFVADSADVNITGCSLLETRAEKLTRHRVRWTGAGTGNLIANCRIQSSVQQTLAIEPAANVVLHDNLLDRGQ